MIVFAKHWINYNGVWHQCGDSFEIEDKDYEAISDHVKAESASVVFPPETEEVVQEAPKRGRPRKRAAD